MSAGGHSWGRYPQVNQTVVDLTDRHRQLPAVGGSLLPYGNGRSYGDSCLNAGNIVLRTRALDHFIAFDTGTGVLECEAGLLLSQILDLVVPQGWFVPVTPGTRFVTIGGAIANDVHGKNHHRAGNFGRHVLELELLRSDGSRRICSRNENPEWFAATVGGLGLTGLITRASIQLRRIAGPWMSTEVHRFDNLAGFFRLSEQSDRDYEYTVAWIDCLARGKALGRGLFTRANHAPAHPDRRPPASASRLRMPFTPPLSLVNRLTLRSFNTLYYYRQRRPVVHATTHYEPHFYPLDGIGEWNRIYGPRGFMQYQCVVPPVDADRRIAQLLEVIAASGRGSFLAVLKQFGNLASPGMLSFPRPGTTLALDFPNQGTRTLTLLDRLDDVVAAAGGAVYPAKDARMSGAHFRQYFPAWEAFRPFVDPHFSSSFWRRVME
ncbi:FAD-binding oxidoreductase [Rhodanobacter sp. C01]|uniref:FAD-binding oxidoreductase n=1 Tax=Rhodanobacter sp. C01 TaxID=1945856 RepID=UPI000987560F|nr:FAD-binding oxidoreductase [Rhodanobacter sp. C01]OOG51077.1 FAD-binding oxidoreductase [Rhodanobacter sp. C01]